ncbi:MAG: sulfite exporter TauE/SafE family protein [Planctomycetota bacterium]|nr:MAG: sulfite exporter TauE/SafE family protein [Planctomycetota bacterium]
MSFLAAFLMGLIGGGGHCLFMCGPLVLALPVQKFKSPLMASFVYHMGRITTYIFLGIFVGFLGIGAHLIGIQQYISIGCGIFLLLFLIPGIKGFFQPMVIKGIGLLKKRWTLGEKKTTPFHYFFLGSLNGLLPCGLVYLAMISSLSLAHFYKSLLFMAFFGLGTFPSLFILHNGKSWFPRKWQPAIQKIYPFLLVFVAVLLILRGLQLGIPYVSPHFSAHGCQGCCH